MDRIHDCPQMADAMGRRARQRFDQLFTGDQMGERYDAIYRSLEHKALETRDPEEQRSNGARI